MPALRESELQTEAPRCDAEYPARSGSLEPRAKVVLAAVSLLVVTALSQMGCVSVQQSTRTVDVPVSARYEDIPTSLEYVVESSVEAARVELQLTAVQRCERRHYETVHRTHITERSEVGGKNENYGEWFWGSVLTGAGAGAWVIGAVKDDPEAGGDWKTGGYVLAGLGAAVLVGAVIDSIRLADSEERVGDVEEPRESKKRVCSTKPVSDEEIQLTLGDRVLGTGTTDGEGTVVFEAALPEYADPDAMLHVVIANRDSKIEQRMPAEWKRTFEDRAAWRRAYPQGCLDALKPAACDRVAAYLREFPAGEFVGDAEEMLAAAEPKLAALRIAERKANGWMRASKSSVVSALMKTGVQRVEAPRAVERYRHPSATGTFTIQGSGDHLSSVEVWFVRAPTQANPVFFVKWLQAIEMQMHPDAKQRFAASAFITTQLNARAGKRQKVFGDVCVIMETPGPGPLGVFTLRFAAVAECGRGR